jgi:hypothetical protein
MRKTNEIGRKDLAKVVLKKKGEREGKKNKRSGNLSAKSKRERRIVDVGIERGKKSR